MWEVMELILGSINHGLTIMWSEEGVQVTAGPGSGLKSHGSCHLQLVSYIFNSKRWRWAKGKRLAHIWPLSAYPCHWVLMFCLCEILFNLKLMHLAPQVDLQLSNTGNGESLLLTATNYALFPSFAAIVGTWELQWINQLWLQHHPAAQTPFDSIPFFLSLPLPLVFK